jgi:hypothetical protein
MSYYTDQSPQRTVVALDDLMAAHLPERAELFALASQNPWWQAKLFDRLVQIFIEHILCFDMETHRPFDKPGIIGYVSSFNASAETTAEGILHLHGTACVCGVPTTAIEIDDALKDRATAEETAEKIKNYVKSVVSHSLPYNGANLTCPNCKKENAYIPVAIQGKAYERADRRQPHGIFLAPLMAACENCNHQVSSQRLNNLMLEQRRPATNWPPHAAMMQTSSRSEPVQHNHLIQAALDAFGLDAGATNNMRCA